MGGEDCGIASMEWVGRWIMVYWGARRVLVKLATEMGLMYGTGCSVTCSQDPAAELQQCDNVQQFL